MADEVEKKPGIDPSRLDTKVGGTRVDTLDGPKSGVTSSDIGGTGIEFDKEGGAKRTGIDAAFDDAEEKDIEDSLKEGDKEEDAGEEAKTEEDKPEGEPDPNAPEPLPEFDPANEEVAKAYEERYFTEDGKLNQEALAAVISANMTKEGGKPELNAGEYAFLEARLGLPRVIVDDHIKGTIALAAEKERAFNTYMGGEGAFEAMSAWAATAYTPEQKDRFNSIMADKTKTEAEKQEQLDLLKSRFAAAGQKFTSPKKDAGKEEGRKAPPPAPVKRALSPPVTTSNSENAGGRAGPEPFKNAEEHRKAQAAAIREGDKSKIDLVRKRLQASTFWR